MDKFTSWTHSLSVDSAGTGVVSHAGSVLSLRTAEKSGLTTALSSALEPWRKPMTSHDPDKVIADLTMALTLGGCLAASAAYAPKALAAIN
ncbi:hypothetical protein AXA44_22035 [Rhodococcus sp. SC4]|nr:hypothetical protein AXA44_22035 [Rhodococcus sp. SC4]